MLKGKFVVLSVIAAALICWQFLPMNTQTASSGIVDPESSCAHFFQAGDRCWFICPQGDGHDLSDSGDEIIVHVSDDLGNPIQNILASDFWVIGCTDLTLCCCSGSIDADSATNVWGTTTISGTMFGGGCDLVGVYVVVQGVVILGNPLCSFGCLLMTVVSPDINADCVVGLLDFTIFAAAYNSILGDPNYNPCCDYDCDGDVDLVDFAARFAAHYNHVGC